MAFIYALIDPRTTEIRYVGKAFDVPHRLRCHWHETRRCDTTRKCNWIKQLKRIGIKPEVEILESFSEDDVDAWQEAERWWIAYLRMIGCNLTNLCSGGVMGNRMSLESRRKLKLSQTGKTVRPEIREKIRKTLTGRKLSTECRLKMSAVQKGKRLSIQHKENIRRAKLGVPMSAEARRAMSIGSIGKRTGKRGPRPDWVREKLRVAANAYYERKRNATP